MYPCGFGAVLAFALFLVADAQQLPPRPPTHPTASTGCSRACIALTGSVKTVSPSLDFPSCTRALSYFAGAFIPDVALSLRNLTASRLLKDVNSWQVESCRHRIADHFDEGFAVHTTELELCGPVSKRVGLALARALTYKRWKRETPLEAHAKALTGFASLASSSCFNTTFAVYGADAVQQIGSTPGDTCAVSWASACTLPPPPPPPTQPPAPPLQPCGQVCLTIAAAVAVQASSLKTPRCRDALTYFRSSLVPDLAQAMSLQGGPSDKFARNAGRWRVAECESSIAEGPVEGAPATINSVKLCGSTARGVGAALAEALTSSPWRGTASLAAHATAMLGFADAPPTACINTTISTSDGLGTADCSASWAADCDAASPEPAPVSLPPPPPLRPPSSPVTATPPPSPPAGPPSPSVVDLLPPPPPPSCSRMCLKWTAAVKTIPPDLNTPACTPSLVYFATTLISDFEAALGSQGSQLAQDLRMWSLTECRHLVQDVFSQGFSVRRVTFTMCGPVSPGVGASLASALSLAPWSVPLEQHARALTGYAALPPATCLNASLTAASDDRDAACAADWASACGAPAPAPPPAAPPRQPLHGDPKAPPPASPPVAVGCTQQCLDISAEVKSFYPNVNYTANCPESLSYFTGAFLSDMEASMTAQGVDAGLIADWAQDAKAWPVDTCNIIVGDNFELGFAFYIVKLKVCGSHATPEGGAAVTAALDPGSWQGSTPLESHVWGLTGFDAAPSSNFRSQSLSALSSDGNAQCLRMWSRKY